MIDWSGDGDPHWQAGIEWQSLCGDAATALDYCVTGAPLPAQKVDTGGLEMRGANPFTVYAEIDCSPVGTNWDRGMADARRLLEMTEAHAVESAFWTGTAAGVLDTVYPHLAADSEVSDSSSVFPVVLQTAATIVTGSTGVTSALGMGALEDAATDCYHGVVTIHVPMIAVASLMHRGIIQRDGARLRTIAGNTVIVGAGYANTSPTGAAAGIGQAWLYATGQVFGYRSAVKTFMREQSLERSTNTLKAIAERTYVLGFECCHHAVLINI
jgi:hypothetical protein